MTAPTPEQSSSGWPAILTWHAHELALMESVRVSMSGKRIKAKGRIISGATADRPAFSASYDLVTDETGATKRLSLSVYLAERDRQLSLARDDENMWLVTGHQGQSRGSYGGALDVDVVFSPFFNALPIRRTGIYQRADQISIPVVYVTLPYLVVSAETITYTNSGDELRVQSPVADTVIHVDDYGFIRDYPGLAARI